MLEAWAAGRTLWPAVPRLQPPREPDQAPHLGRAGDEVSGHRRVPLAALCPRLRKPSGASASIFRRQILPRPCHRGFLLFQVAMIGSSLNRRPIHSIQLLVIHSMIGRPQFGLRITLRWCARASRCRCRRQATKPDRAGCRALIIRRWHGENRR